MIEPICKQLTNGEIGIREAIFKLLTSPIGEEDLNSFKFKVLQNFFGFNADSDEEAIRIVQCSIKALQQNTVELKLQQ